MTRLLYTLLLYLMTPAVVARLWWRGRALPAYRLRIGERFGWVPKLSSKPRLWVHAVSVGESLAAIPMIEAFQRAHPDWQVVVTTTTPTGAERVVASLGDTVVHCYAPYDLPGALARFLRRTRPRVAVIMETELWPNTVAALARRKIPVIVANARLSASSAEGYRKLRWLIAPLLKRVSRVAAQDSADGERFVELGLPRHKLTITGNIKFDLTLSDAQHAAAKALRDEFGERPVWIAASTHEGEETLLLTAHRALQARMPGALLMLVPRHPERFDAVATQCRQSGFKVVRRSAGTAVDAQADILLGDTMGELLALYGAAQVAFVGGSLVPVGGHNLIEPAAWSLPVITGPYLHNFSAIADLLREAGGLEVAADAVVLSETLAGWMQQPARRRQLGEAAHRVAAANRGALERLLTVIDSVLG